ncbi:MAG: phosphotransferase [Sphingomonadales bacterium]|nr:phosphotransferase [Sphingomonadales bacterium]
MSLPRWLSLKPVVPHDWADVTPDWMTRAIASHHPDAVIDRVDIVMRDDGTNRRARFALHYASGTGPAQVFVKAHAAAHRMVHLRNGNLFNEARLFAHGDRIPCEHPAVYLAVPDYPRLDFLLVMEDITLRGGDPRDATRPLTPAQVASGLEELAKVHRIFWGLSARSHRGLGWVKPWAVSKGWTMGLGKRIPIGLERTAGKLPGGIDALSGDAVLEYWTRYVRSLSQGPHTLLHGDAHIGNCYVLPGDKVGWLDWQVVRRGNWSQDLGYFLVGALTEADRRAHERELVEHYRQALDLGANTPSPEEVWHRYRLSPAYGLAIWLSTLGTDGWQRHEISLALAQRYAAAMVDLDTANALDEAGV